MSQPKLFCATSVDIGMCASPTCRRVHIQLLDETGTVRAQAVIGCESIDQVAADLKAVKARVLGNTSLEVH